MRDIGLPCECARFLCAGGQAGRRGLLSPIALQVAQRLLEALRSAASPLERLEADDDEQALETETT